MNVIKKVFFIALMIWMLFLVISNANVGTINTDAVRIRREPTTSSDVIVIANKNEEVEIIEKANEWYKVKYGIYTGYVRNDLLNVVENTVTNSNAEQNVETKPEVENTGNTNNNANVEAQEIQYVVKDTTNVKILPSISSSSITSIEKGTNINIVTRMNNWVCIELNSKTGWIPSVYIEEKTQEQPSEAVSNTNNSQTTKTGYISVSLARIRVEPNTSCEVLTTMSRNKSVEIIEELDGWYKIKLDNNFGYISKSLVSDKQSEVTSRGLEEQRQEEITEPIVQEEQVETVIKSVYVNVDKANIRKEPNTTSNIALSANRKDKLDVLSEENGWYKVKLSSENAYIRKDLVVDKIEDVVIPKPVVEEKKETSTTVGNNSTPTGQAVVDYAKKFLGCKYTYGGAGPSSFDCSGFTQYVYKKFGISLSHSAVTQASNGSKVEKSNLQLGDLIIFRDWDNKSIGHCGIYIGNSKFIHAANPSRGVVTDTFASGYYKERYVCARRLF